MERKFNHDDFEQFLKESAEGLRMHPSPAVWKAISRELDRKRRRFFGFMILALGLLTGAYFTWQTAVVTPTYAIVQTKAAGTPAAATAAQKAVPTKSAPNNILKTSSPTSALQHTYATVTQKVSAPEKNIVIAAPDAIPEATDIALAIAPVPSNFSAANTPIDLLAADKKELNTDSLLATPPSATAATTPPSIAATKKQKANRRLQWQVFATPTVSYRKLSDNKGYQRPILTTGIPATVSALYSINNAVIHKPDLGIELGLMAKYSLSRNLKLRTGFQFNMSRYDIKAFSYVPEVATIALNNGMRVDSVRAISSYRNFGVSSRTNWLQNFYFQASMPVGMELKVLGNSRTYAGIASTLQPTYIIGNRAYLITADYKNYARVPWLTRRWNVNTNFEAFITHRTAKTEWQIGPQVRYQILSSFINEYPVKENLFDFGLKVGVRIR